MIQQFNEQNDINMYNMVQFTLPTLLETNQLLSRLVAEQERGNALQEQILEELKKEKKGVKRKVSSVSSPTNSSSNCSTTESEKKKCKKNATCSNDELCISYEGSSNHSIIIRKELLKGPVLGAAISGNFLQESTFVLPSDSIKLSNISKTMKQLKKFFHGEQLDKINEETKTDLFNLADFLALPELKLELLKIKIAETPVQKKNNLSLLYTIVNQVSKQLPGILLDLDHDEILQGLKSFHDFIATGTRSINFVVACFHVLFQYADIESIQKIGVIFVPKGVYGPSPHFAQTLVNTLDEMKHRLIKIWLEDEFQSDDKEMKIRLVNQSIVNPHLKVAITGN